MPINPQCPKVVLTYGRATLTLDASEIVPGDPGAGTPIVVDEGPASATWSCALNEGEDADGYPFSAGTLLWLDSIAQEVDAWERVQFDRVRAESARA